MPAKPFNSVVAARTRAAAFILNTNDLLDKFIGLGGLKEDLERIQQAGATAETFNQAQGMAINDGKTATLDIVRAFAALEGEYSLVMGILRAVRGQLVAEKAAEAIIQRIDSILTNEAEVAFAAVADAEGQPKRKAKKRLSHEAIRAEIFRDAQSLLAFSEIADRLTARRCPRTRIEKLKTDAEALSGKLASRAGAKGNQKTVSKQEHEAVAGQSASWSASYRLLFALGRLDPRVASILSEAAGSRKR